jgi:hypothetical protein
MQAVTKSCSLKGIKHPWEILTFLQSDELLHAFSKLSLYNAVRHNSIYFNGSYLHPPWRPKIPVNSGHLLLCVMFHAIAFTQASFSNLSEKPPHYISYYFKE